MQKTLKKYFPIFLFPTVIAFCIAFVIPFITGLYLSFCNFTTVSNAKFVGFENYIKAFSSSQRFGQAFGFTTLFTIISIITVNIIAFTLAYLLTKKIKGTNFFRTVFFMPNLIGGIVLGYTWQSMINAILANYGTTLVANAKYGFIGLIIHRRNDYEYYTANCASGGGLLHAYQGRGFFRGRYQWHCKKIRHPTAGHWFDHCGNGYQCTGGCRQHYGCIEGQCRHYYWQYCGQ